MRYIVNASLPGDFKVIGVGDLGTVEPGSTVVVVLGDSTNGKLPEYYTGLKEVLKPKKQNKVILLIDGAKSDIRQPLCNLCVHMECYDIYSIDDISDVTVEYIQELENREPTLTEVSTFISSSLSGYDEMANTIVKLTDYISRGDIEGLNSLVADEFESLLTFPELLDYMQVLIAENTSLETGNSKQAIVELDKKTRELTLKLQEKEELSESYKDVIQGLEEEVVNLKEKYDEAASRNADNSKSGITQYRTISLNKLRGATVQKVLYFKEVTPVPYVNSMLYFLQRGLTGDLLGFKEDKKCKIVVYDKSNEFVSVYQDLQLVDGEKMAANPNILKTSKNILVTEPSQHILESLLKSDNEIMIIYDKMRMNNDLVDGYTVTKFHVINSKKEVEALERAKGVPFNHRRLVTGFGAFSTTLQVKTFEGFRTNGDTAKQAHYIKTTLPGSQERLYDAILKESGLKSDT